MPLHAIQQHPPASGQSALDGSLPTLELRALARRAAVPAALAVVAVAVVALAGGPLGAFADALGRVVDADPRWVVAGAAFELLSFGGYIALLWLVGLRWSCSPTSSVRWPTRSRFPAA